MISPLSDSLQPYFPSIVENVTVSYGRKAVLKCEVENLRNYKVSQAGACDWAINGHCKMV